MMLFIKKMFYCCNLKITFYMKDVHFPKTFVVVKLTESEEWTYFTYFKTVNKYRF